MEGWEYGIYFQFLKYGAITHMESFVRDKTLLETLTFLIPDFNDPDSPEFSSILDIKYLNPSTLIKVKYVKIFRLWLSGIFEKEGFALNWDPYYHVQS